MTEEILNKLKNIKFLILDVDGVLTDGKIVYSEKGEELKFFSVYDGYGINRLQRAGIKVGIISGRNSAILQKRASDLKIEDVIQGTIQKDIAAETFIEKYNLKWEEVAFIGDELFDVPLMLKVGFSAAPQNAFTDVKKSADYITQRSGGDGAVREVIDLIFEAKGITNFI